MTKTLEKCDEKEETQNIKKRETLLIKEKKVGFIKKGSERKYKYRESKHTLYSNILCCYYSLDLHGLEETFKNELNVTHMKLIFYTKEVDII